MQLDRKSVQELPLFVSLQQIQDVLTSSENENLKYILIMDFIFRLEPIIRQ